MKKRKEVLAELLQINQEQISSRYSGESNDYWELIVDGTYYDVLKDSEFKERLFDMFNEIMTEDELEANYGVRDASKVNYDDVDPDIWLGEKLGKYNGYHIYRTN